MPEWSEQPDKVLCRCGVVSWTPARLEGNAPKYTLRDACPGCSRTDDVEEICSTKKMSLKKASATIEAVCDLLEIEPLQVLNGRAAGQVEDLAQHFEDLSRPQAAERLRKGLEALKAGMLKGMSAVKLPNGGPTAVPGQGPSSAKAGPYMMVPGCAKCRAPVTDYPEHRGTAKGLLCWKCRATVEGPALIQIIEAELAQRQKSLDHITWGMRLLKDQLATLKASPKP